jgi:hypothetical protein
LHSAHCKVSAVYGVHKQLLFESDKCVIFTDQGNMSHYLYKLAAISRVLATFSSNLLIPHVIGKTL